MKSAFADLRPSRAWWYCCLLALAAAWPAAARAGGSLASPRGNDLILTVDWRWAGCIEGGYYPVRIRVTNVAPRSRPLRFVLASSDSRTPQVERRLLVGPNSTQDCTLSVPVVSLEARGQLRVYDNGRLLESLSQLQLSLNDSPGVMGGRPALLVIHPDRAEVECTPFDQALQALIVPNDGTYYGGGWPTGSFVGVRPSDSQVVDPGLLPESWLDYSGLDVIAISLANFGKLSPPARTAITQWTEAGGTLLVFDVGEAGAKSTELDRLLELSARRGVSQKWEPAVPAEHRIISTNAAMATMGATPIPQGTPGNDPLQLAVEAVNKTAWQVSDSTFSRLDLVSGRVYAFPRNPFPGAPIDWAWWLNSTDWRRKVSWSGRLGTSGVRPHPQFFEYLIPGVGAVPVLAFVGLISLFAIVIGPVNYFVLLKKKQLYLLVATIPVIAFLTSAALFGYAMVADGFAVRSRARSVTLLDQGTSRAVTFARISLYAGLAPSSGLRFGGETGVFPIWPDDTGLESGSVDWTEAQDLKTGWLRSRTPAQFETVAHRTNFGKLDVQAADVGAAEVEVTNRFEWPLAVVVLRGENGRLFSGRDLAPGASARLQQAADEDVNALAQALADDRPQAPPGVVGTMDVTPFSSRRMQMMYYSNRPDMALALNGSTLEVSLNRLSQPTQDPQRGGLAPRCYIGLFRDNPGVELGLSRTRATKALHVVQGYY